MGKSRIVNRILYIGGAYSGIEWKGPATPAVIEKWITAYVKSQYPGGPNEHIAKRLGYIDVPQRAEISDRRIGIIASWTMPKFWALP